ncbi:MAG TPA: hypothetical protein VEA92_02405 [Candidatus Paceibacterota bacterium]|nr:hypothetical protein [Candidatus Paceibacterota bacterium]
MRTPVVLGIIVALFVSLAGFGWWRVSITATDTATTTPTIPSLPRDSGATVVLTSKANRIITVPDFTYGHPSVEVEDTGITYVYLTQNDDLVELDHRYGIVYGSDSTISIGLLASPLGASRTAAETKLRELIPLADDILCSLKIAVQTADTIEPRFAGKELGLSFCPGAVPLP